MLWLYLKGVATGDFAAALVLVFKRVVMLKKVCAAGV